jgi:hypothetical protein
MMSRLAVAIACAVLAACSPPERGGASRDARGGASRDAAAIAKTEFPGQLTAGGGTSGEVMARAQASGANPSEAGTPGIPQGAEGNVGGTAPGGTTGSSSIAGSGKQSPSQSAKGATEQPAKSAPPSPTAR